MIRPLLYLVGYSILSVSEADAVRLLGLFSAGGIIYHDAGVGTDSAGETRRYFRVRTGVARRVIRICVRMEIEIRVESRHGAPADALRLCRRPGLLLGAVLFAVCALYLGGRVWDIRVEGARDVSEATVVEVLRQSGISVGCKKSELDIDAIENRALILSDQISWISVNIVGTVAEVEIREAVIPPRTEDYVASNLVATANGTVVRFEEVRGNIAVKIGESVSEGQLLVGGVYGSDKEATRFVRSSGRVIALCEREYTVEIPLTFDKKVYTGEQKIKKSLIFFEKEVKFFGNSRNLYASCDTIDTVRYFNPFGLGDLPFGVRTQIYAECVTQQAVRTEEQAREQAYHTLWQMLDADAPDAIVASKHLEGRVEDGKYILEATVECFENIAKEQEIEVKIQ